MVSIYLAMWSLFVIWANLQFYGGRAWLVVLKTVCSLLLTQVVIYFLLYIFIRWIF